MLKAKQAPVTTLGMNALHLIQATVEPGTSVSHEWIQEVVEAYVASCLDFGLDQGEDDVTYADNGLDPSDAKTLDPAGYSRCSAALHGFLNQYGTKLKSICPEPEEAGGGLRESVASSHANSTVMWHAKRAGKEQLGLALHDAMRKTKWYITCRTRTQRLVFKEAKWE